MLLGGKAGDRRLNDRTNGSLVDCDERLVVHEGEESHDELAVHAICHASVAGDRVAKILDVEGTFEARGEETTEWSDERCKCRHGQDVELHRCYRDCSREESILWRDERKLVGPSDEDRIRFAVEAREDVGAKVCDGADEVF